MSQIISVQYSDQFSVDFTNDVWFNATAVAKNFGKLPNEWLRLESTQEYIQKLTNFLLRENPAIKSEDFSLQKTQRGRYNSGTWFHPKLAVAFARWLDVDFAIWCDMQIEKMLHPQLVESTTITDAEYKTLTNAMKAACFVGKTFDKSAYTKMIGELTTAYGKRKLEQLPAGKVNEMLVFLKLRQPKSGEMMLVAVEEFESLQALRALPPPQEQQVFPENYHQFIDVVNKMESANYRIFKKDVLVALHEMLTKMI